MIARFFIVLFIFDLFVFLCSVDHKDLYFADFFVSKYCYLFMCKNYISLEKISCISYDNITWINIKWVFLKSTMQVNKFWFSFLLSNNDKSYSGRKEQSIDIIINPKRYDWCWINNDYVFSILEEFIFYTYFDTEVSSI